MIWTVSLEAFQKKMLQCSNVIIFLTAVFHFLLTHLSSASPIWAQWLFVAQASDVQVGFVAVKSCPFSTGVAGILSIVFLHDFFQSYCKKQNSKVIQKTKKQYRLEDNRDIESSYNQTQDLTSLF